MSKYPECEKMQEIQEKSQAIGEFLEWLGYEKEIQLCKYMEDDELEDGSGYYGINICKETLLAEFFDIDLDKVEKEKRQILKKLQKNQK